MTRRLISSRRFLPVFLAQTLATFNDNFLKNVLVFLALAQAGKAEAGATITLSGAIFIAPFLLLSALGGQMADRFDKARLARWLKLCEIGAAGIALLGMVLASVPVLLVALFLFGSGSALFGPLKYGILPEQLQSSELPRANAWIEGATFVAILAGTVAAGVAFTASGADWRILAPALIAVAIGAWVASCFIPLSAAAAPGLRLDVNILRSSWHIVRDVRRNERLWTTTLMLSWFWLSGGIVLSLLPLMIRRLGGDDLAITACLAVFAVAVGIGSALSAWLAKGRIMLLPAVLGAAVIGLIAIDLGFAVHAAAGAISVPGPSELFLLAGPRHALVDLALIAMAGALIAVPCFAALQAWAESTRRARVIAGANIVSSGIMTVGGIVMAALQHAGISIETLSFALGGLSLTAAGTMLFKLPTDPRTDATFLLFRADHT